jgi:N6-L-threonylcarbamoyladenine synthase
MDGPGHYRVLGETIDDAAGEAYDKVARHLGLGYPGGPAIDRLARDGDATAVSLPISMSHDTYDFSFSGLKSAVVRACEKNPALAPADVAASFQSAVCAQLLKKVRRAVATEHVAGIALAGGVAANSALRDGIRSLAEEEGVVAHVPALAWCTDNAAMIAAAGTRRVATPSSLTLSATPSWPLQSLQP